MLSTSILCTTLSALILSVNGLPSHLDKRQAPRPVPPYVEQGVAIYKCVTPNTVALTFDDGLTDLSESTVSQLNNAGMHGTFFVNGDNYDLLSTHQSTLQRIVDSGHQVGSHTWSHPYLGQLSSADVRSEMTRLENEMLNLIGRYPTYMRPPYFDFNSQTLSVLSSLKYRVIITDLDTNDWKGDPNASFEAFRQGLDQGGSIVLSHDVHETTINDLLPRMISELQSRGMKSVTVGECLGEDPANWYRYAPRS